MENRKNCEMIPPEPSPRNRDPIIELYKKGIDKTLLQENLKCSVEKRFLNLMALQRFAEELQKQHPRPSASK